ncbi:MAG: nickel-type superoxide dismutase maturation protease [Chloroflexi bacterium]|nr:nickel-type superoxide dismutase maturation protease [Chloroflexota bacterium]
MSTGRGTRLLLVLILVALGASLGRRRLDVVEVRGRSMSPTLIPGDRLVVARLGSRAGDVVLVRDPRDPSRELIKRAVCVDHSGVVLRGDNPAASTDARTFGSVPAATVSWRVVLRYWPIHRAGRLPPPVAHGLESA